MTTLSPSSRGLLPGLFLGLAVAFGVLALNDSWLLPALDDDGVAYLVAAPQLAAGDAPSIPSSTWEEPGATAGLEGRGSVMPLAMAGVVRLGRRPHVAALWMLALSAGILALTAAWVAGGASGSVGAIAAVLALFLSPGMMSGITTVRPEILVAALVGLQLGLMVYRPAWSWAHGAVAAVAWLAHPVGIGAVAAAVVWPLRSQRTAAAAGQALVGMAPAVTLGVVGAVWAPVLIPPAMAPPTLSGAMAAAAGTLEWAGGGWGGALGMVLGVGGLLAVLFLVWTDSRDTVAPPDDVHWSHPGAADGLQGELRPAAGVMALALLLGAAFSAGGAGDLARPWLPVVVPLATLAGATAVRRGRGRAGAPSWIPTVLLAVWILMSGANALRGFSALQADGKGHTAAKWVASEVIRWVDNRSQPYPVIYASHPTLLLLQSGRVARALPTQEGHGLAFLEAFQAAPGAVVLTGESASVHEALVAPLDLREVVRATEGRVLVPRDQPEG